MRSAWASDHQPMLASAPAVMPGAGVTGTLPKSARETFSPAVDGRGSRQRTGCGKPTFVGEIHGKGGADMYAGDEPLVLEQGHFVELTEDDVLRDVTNARAEHDEEGIALSAFELPLGSEGRSGEAGDAAAGVPVSDTACVQDERRCAHTSGPTLRSRR